MADCHEVEGTRLVVLELLMFGFAYASRYLLLKSRAIVDSLEDPAVSTEIARNPSKFGRTLEFGRDMEWDSSKSVIYYIAPVEEEDLVQPGNT